MTELKFRAWDGKNLFLSGKCDNYQLGEWFDAHSKKGLNGKENIIMQFTGIKNKNGNSIFEGDILSEKHKCVWLHFIVCFGEYKESEGNKNEGVGFYLKAFREDTKKYQIINFYKKKVEDFEVIGNIYENPELLIEVKNKRKYDDERLEEAYQMGLDSGINGANTTNCNFSLFDTPDRKGAWEQGNKEGLQNKKEGKRKPIKRWKW